MNTKENTLLLDLIRRNSHYHKNDLCAGRVIIDSGAVFQDATGMKHIIRFLDFHNFLYTTDNRFPLETLENMMSKAISLNTKSATGIQIVKFLVNSTDFIDLTWQDYSEFKSQFDQITGW